MLAKETIEINFAFDTMGTVEIYHRGIHKPLRIAHLTDPHVLPEPLDGYDENFAEFVRWQSRELGNPNGNLRDVCSRVIEEQPDMVLVSGDIVDFLDERAIRVVLEDTGRIGAPVYFSRGNHEAPWSLAWWNGKPVSTPELMAASRGPGGPSDNPSPDEWPNWGMQFSQQPFEKVSKRFGLENNAQTGSMDYTVLSEGIRFILLDGSTGHVTSAQADWVESQVRDGLAFMVVSHIPFPAATLKPRSHLIYHGIMSEHYAQDEACGRMLGLMERPNFLGALVGHVHFRSEDVLGHACQLLTGPASFGMYRIVDLLPWDTPREFSPTSNRRMRDARTLYKTRKQGDNR